METKTFTKEEILELNAKRKTPCITESGGCFVVKRLRIFADSIGCSIQSAKDVNVFATEREAREWVAKMAKRFDDACSAEKFCDIVEWRNIYLD
jgi:hypothetical protein|nr:MAG TPA: hypothetical protein [Caudoviricetes sp.]